MPIYKRIKQSPAVNSGTSLTLTFDEGTPLDTTHTLLVAISASGGAAPTTPSGWTLISPGSASYGSTLWLGFYIKQGDGTTNSVTLTFSASQTQMSATLFGFEGFVSTTVDSAIVATNNASATSALAGPANASVAANTIAIAAVGLQSSGGGTWGTWDSGFETVPISQSRLHIGLKAFTTSGQTPSTNISWSVARGSRDVIFMIQGTVPAPNNAPLVTIDSIPDAYAGDTVSAVAHATDTDGTIASYLWSVAQCDVTPPTLLNATSPTVSFVPDKPMTVTLRCTVLDNAGASGSATSAATVTIDRQLPSNRSASRWSKTNRSQTSQIAQYRGASTNLGLIAEWKFSESAAPFYTTDGSFPLAQVGSVPRITTPWGYGVNITGSPNYLVAAAANLGGLNMGRSTNKVTVAAWVYRTDANTGFIAGAWQEDNNDPRRQYGLFIDLGTYGGSQMSCFHVSKLGSATPGYPFSIDYSASKTLVQNSRWEFHVGTYDGTYVRSYLNGTFTPYTNYTDNQSNTYDKNPYYFPNGLNTTLCDFTVGAVKLTSGMSNFFEGSVAKLRVWNRALSAAEITRLYADESSVL
ncbi:MAG: LamG-like jellyroll fold domain-containing protein [Candidatus Microsaccharimonas sp.]